MVPFKLRPVFDAVKARKPPQIAKGMRFQDWAKSAITAEEEKGKLDEKALAKLEDRHESIDRKARYAVSAASDRAHALERLEQARDTSGEVDEDQLTVDVSTQDFELPDGKVFELEVFLNDVDGNTIRRELRVNANTGPSDCRCRDVGLYSYTGVSRAKINGDGGDICSDSRDLFRGQLYAVFGNKPSCITQPVQKGRQACGCFDDRTKIRMADGTDRRITEIKSGDMIFNPVTAKATRVLYTVSGPETLPMLRVQTKHRSVVVTSKHPFPTERGYLPAYRLEAGDTLLSDKTKEVITEIKTLPQSEDAPTVWNIMLAGDEHPRNHMLLGDGLVTGDLFLQNKLERERKRDEWELSDRR